MSDPASFQSGVCEKVLSKLQDQFDDVVMGIIYTSSEEQKSQLIVSYDYLASIVLYSKYVIISQCTVMHVV